MEVNKQLHHELKNINRISQFTKKGLMECIHFSTIMNTMKNLQDRYTWDMLYEDINEYISHDYYITKRNKSLGQEHKQCRRENFPSSASENIAKFAIAKKYGIYPTWNTDKGDLKMKLPKQLQLEVKGFRSDGPLSFGPKENWDYIYFVDCKNFMDLHFKVYEIQLSNTSKEWRSIIMSGKNIDCKTIEDLPDGYENYKVKDLKELCEKRCLSKSGKKDDLINRIKYGSPGSKHKPQETFGDIVDKNQRGKLRGGFESIFKPQLGEQCKMIFDGHISELKDTL